MGFFIASGAQTCYDGRMTVNDNWYCVIGDGITPHFCSSYYLAQAVRDNIFKRYFKECKIENWPTKHFQKLGLHYDIGFARGTYFTQRMKELEISKNVYIWWNDLESGLLRIEVEKFSQNVEKYGNFNKIHCADSILCLTLAQSDIVYKRIVQNMY